MKKMHSQKGFTIIELAIATLVFSVLLAIVMAAFLNVGRLFVKGVNLSLTQTDARAIMDSISSDIRFSQASPDLSGMSASSPYFCIGQHRYKFNLYQQVGQSTTPYGLVREDVSAGCPSLRTAGSNPVEMLGNEMQLNDLHFGPAAGNTCSGNLCTVTINLLFYGADNTVFTSSEHPNSPIQALKDPDAHCDGADLGTQFCATTSYTTSVLQSSQ